MTDDEIYCAIDVLRARAVRVGPLHAYWDLIFNAEELLAGRRTMLTRPEILSSLQEVTAKLYVTFASLPVGATFHRAADVRGQYWQKIDGQIAEDIPAAEQESIAYDEVVLEIRNLEGGR